MPLLLATGVTPPLVEIVAAWSQMGLTWQGGNSHDVFDLADVTTGILLSQGVRGLGMPPVTAYTDDSPALAGARYRGSQIGPRSVFWPLFIWSDVASQEWVDRDRAFWSTMDPDVPGVWSVTAPDGSTRRLLCQYTDDGDQVFTVDPFQYGWALYGVTLTAYDEPYWLGDPILRTFQAPADVPFFLTSGGVFQISPGGTTDSAFIPNPGDVDAWPLWTVNGPITSAHLGAGGGAVDVPFSLSGGQSLTVDTRPSKMTAIDDSGTDRSGDVTWAPLPVPAGSEVELDITVAGTSGATAVACELTPRYRRAW